METTYRIANRYFEDDHRKHGILYVDTEEAIHEERKITSL